MAEDHFLADWLNEQLKARNLSQGELARQGRVAKSVIHRVCARKVVQPDVSTYVAIAKGLGMPLITVLRETVLMRLTMNFLNWKKSSTFCTN
jgi:transcriptional regulator with XRE-family HTH domain